MILDLKIIVDTLTSWTLGNTDTSNKRDVDLEKEGFNVKIFYEIISTLWEQSALFIPEPEPSSMNQEEGSSIPDPDLSA